MKNQGFRTLNASKMGCTCDKEVLFFGEGSRDPSLLLYLFLIVYRHDLIGLKNRRFCPVKNDRKGKNALKLILTYFEQTMMAAKHYSKTTYWTAVITSLPLVSDQILLENRFLVSFGDDDMSPFLQRSFNLFWCLQ